MVRKSAGPNFNRRVVSTSRKYVIKTRKQQKNNEEVVARQQEWPPSACPKCSYWTSTSLNYKNSGRQKRNCKVSQSLHAYLKRFCFCSWIAKKNFSLPVLHTYTDSSDSIIIRPRARRWGLIPGEVKLFLVLIKNHTVKTYGRVEV